MKFFSNNFKIIQIIGFIILSIGIPLFLLISNDLAASFEDYNNDPYGHFPHPLRGLVLPLLIIITGIGLILQQYWARIILLIMLVLVIIITLTSMEYYLGFTGIESLTLTTGIIGICTGMILLLFNQKTNEELKHKSEESSHGDILDAE